MAGLVAAAFLTAGLVLSGRHDGVGAATAAVAALPPGTPLDHAARARPAHGGQLHPGHRLRVACAVAARG
ncbi:MAG TPA: hypothetical protein VNV17_23850 [Solirubrobacteraceae bacterium]|nr:hypothetical protein [Solirubrobacteraceae bacterium]